MVSSKPYVFIALANPNTHDVEGLLAVWLFAGLVDSHNCDWSRSDALRKRGAGGAFVYLGD